VKTILLLLLVSLASCSGAQRPVTWDVAALATIHTTAHGVALADDGAEAYYRARTDALAADGGVDGGPLRGAAYIVATAPLDATYVVFVRDLSTTRAALVLAETLVRQAVALGVADLRCRAGLAVHDLVTDLDLVVADLATLGVASDPLLLADGQTLASIVTDLTTACTDGAVAASPQDIR